MPFVPSPLERLLLNRLNVGPAATLDLLGSVGVKTMLTARRLGVIDALDSGPLSIDDLAEAIDARPDRLERLLEALVEWGYLRRRGDRYALTRGTAKWLTTGSGLRYHSFVEWWDGLVFPYWETEMVDLLRGKGTGRLYEWVGDQPNGWARAQAGFEATARLIMPGLVKKLRVPSGTARMLDAGGGHGLYSIALCQAHPGLRADILDFPQALERARDNVLEAGLETRVRIIPGDLTTDHLGEGYDLVLMANVIHGFAPDQNTDILRKAHDALTSGGKIHILDQFGRVPGRLGRAINAMLGLAYLTIGEGRIYTESEVGAWLEASGFADHQMSRLRAAPGNGVITATRT